MKKRRRHISTGSKVFHEAVEKRRRRSLKEIVFSKNGLFFFLLLLFAFSLNAIDLYWGMSGYITWQPDSIEGEIAVNHLPLMFHQWRHKYPRGQFLINWFFYYPLVKHWAKNPVTQQNSSGEISQIVLNDDRMRFLASITRWINIVMRLGTIIAVFVLTKYLFSDYLAGWLAGFAMSISSLFLFFSSIGHIDVPFTFWFAWACFFCVRAARQDKWLDYILLAFCAGYALCTKEGYFGYLPGLAVVYVVLRATEQYKKTKNIKESLSSVFSPKVFAAIGIFLLLFVIMNGAFNFVKEITGRMQYWKEDPTFHVERSYLSLLMQAGTGLYTGLGWPFLAAIVTGIIYFAFRHKSALAVVLIPVVVFYLVTVLRIRFVAERFFLPAYVCFAVVIGKTAADWIRYKKVPAAIRYTAVSIIGGLTILYCVGLKLEMKNDTRVRTEAWFSKNVSKDTVIGSGMKRWYAPRLKYQGYDLIDGWNSKGVNTSKGMVLFFPEYLIESQMFPCSSNYEDDSAFKEKLYNGKAGYKKVASFEALYFPPSFSVFAIAGWPYKSVYSVSPTVDVFKKETGSHN